MGGGTAYATRMFRAFLFDLDGTLIDSLPGIAASLNRALTAEGWPTHPSVSVKAFIGNGSWWLARRALPADAPDTAADAVEASFKADYAVTWPDGTLPFPEVPELLSELSEAGKPLAVLSNKPHPFTVEIVDRLFPSLNFAQVRGETPGVAPKPDPAGATAIAEALHLPPAEVLFVGDSRVDAETAARAGMPVALVAWGYDAHVRSVSSRAGWCETVADLRRLLTG